jgi:hypothetical protein
MTSPNGQNKVPETDQIVTNARECKAAVLRQLDELQKNTEK